MKIAVRDLLFYSKNGYEPALLYASTPVSLYSQLQSLNYCEPRDCMFLNVAVRTPAGDFLFGSLGLCYLIAGLLTQTILIQQQIAILIPRLRIMKER